MQTQTHPIRLLGHDINAAVQLIAEALGLRTAGHQQCVPGRQPRDIFGVAAWLAHCLVADGEYVALAQRAPAHARHHMRGSAAHHFRNSDAAAHA